MRARVRRCHRSLPGERCGRNEGGWRWRKVVHVLETEPVPHRQRFNRHQGDQRGRANIPEKLESLHFDRKS